MKTKHFLIIGVVGAVLAGSIVAGCKKDTTTTTTTTTAPTDYTAAQDDANASFTIEDTKNIADGAAKGQATDRVLSSCWHVKKISDTTYNSVHDSCWDINFGTTDCLCSDNRLRRGEVLVFWNGKGYFSTGASIIMTFRNYYMNDIGITGTRTLTNTSSTVWDFVANLSLTYANNGGTATWSSTRTDSLKTIGGVSYVSITGTANGTSRKGTTYSVNITSPIYVTALPPILGGCKYFEAGNVTVALPLYSIGLTFGTAIGTCSDAATATIDKKTYNFLQQ